jgi:hypothetical protein
MPPHRVASDQPTFLPWAGLFHKLIAIDFMIWSVAVPVSYGSRDHYHNRVRLKGSWLSLPITSKTNGVPFHELTFDTKALPKVARSLRNSFGRAFQFHKRTQNVADLIDGWKLGDNLAELNTALIMCMSGHMAAQHWHHENDLVTPDPKISKTERLIERVRRLAGSGPIEYYMGAGAMRYMDVALMRSAGIATFVQRLNERAKDETAMQLIASNEKPTLAIERMGSWERL